MLRPVSAGNVGREHFRQTGTVESSMRLNSKAHAGNERNVHPALLRVDPMGASLWIRLRGNGKQVFGSVALLI